MESAGMIKKITAISDKLAAGCKLTNNELTVLMRWQFGLSRADAHELVRMILRYKRLVLDYVKRN